MPKKNVGVVYLLIKQDGDEITARQAHHDLDAEEYAFGDGMIELKTNEQALARNLIRSLKRNLEAGEGTGKAPGLPGD